MKKLKVISDGTPAGTQVLLPDGTPVPGITSVSFKIDAHGDKYFTVDFSAYAELDVVGEVT
jgi:hypothetical protein